ncbi:CrcB family protein [Streptacidiphilus sp. NEAU-YB345]|uniref:Fluoride-specific ion channel FluC n=1 Tax=Streptacidiphilus fuscans TaxID=2789292 RepID=A0A931FFI8_9ACTN|nr:CrcB family protein [Streptacidiphilus fuscans]
MLGVTARKGPRDLDVLAVIALGGGIGSIARYGLSRAMPTPAGGFPWATFVTNVVGCAVLGALMYLVLEVWPPSRYRRPFLGVGICGGFTTFSTAVVESRGLLAGGHAGTAFAYLAGSLFAGLAAVAAGAALARLSGRARRPRGHEEPGPGAEPVPATGPTEGRQ